MRLRAASAFVTGPGVSDGLESASTESSFFSAFFFFSFGIFLVAFSVGICSPCSSKYGLVYEGISGKVGETAVGIGGLLKV